MPDAKSSQSQSISGTSIAGSQISMGQAQGGSVIQTQQGNHSDGTSEKGLMVIEVVSLLDQLEELLKGSGLSAEDAEKLKNRLNVVKEDVQEKEPDKDQAAKGLKKVADALKMANDSADAGKGLWEKAVPIFGQLVGWFGVAKTFFGLL